MAKPRPWIRRGVATSTEVYNGDGVEKPRNQGRRNRNRGHREAAIKTEETQAVVKSPERNDGVKLNHTQRRAESFRQKRLAKEAHTTAAALSNTNPPREQSQRYIKRQSQRSATNQLDITGAKVNEIKRVIDDPGYAGVSTSAVKRGQDKLSEAGEGVKAGEMGINEYVDDWVGVENAGTENDMVGGVGRGIKVERDGSLAEESGDGRASQKEDVVMGDGMSWRHDNVVSLPLR